MQFLPTSAKPKTQANGMASPQYWVPPQSTWGFSPPVPPPGPSPSPQPVGSGYGPPVQSGGGQNTTAMMGEEGGGLGTGLSFPPPSGGLSGGGATTQMIGEEGGGSGAGSHMPPIGVSDHNYTTTALGEEGGGGMGSGGRTQPPPGPQPVPGPQPTPTPQPQPAPGPGPGTGGGTYTTQMMGEEGGGGANGGLPQPAPIGPPVDPNIQRQHPFGMGIEPKEYVRMGAQGRTLNGSQSPSTNYQTTANIYKPPTGTAAALGPYQFPQPPAREQSTRVLESMAEQSAKQQEYARKAAEHPGLSPVRQANGGWAFLNNTPASPFDVNYRQFSSPGVGAASGIADVRGPQTLPPDQYGFQAGNAAAAADSRNVGPSGRVSSGFLAPAPTSPGQPATPSTASGASSPAVSQSGGRSLDALGGNSVQDAPGMWHNPGSTDAWGLGQYIANNPAFNQSLQDLVRAGIGQLFGGGGRSISGGPVDIGTLVAQMLQNYQNQINAYNAETTNRDNTIRQGYKQRRDNIFDWTAKSAGNLSDSYQNREDKAMDIANSIGGSMLQNVKDKYTQERARVPASLIDRGLYNTTIHDSLMRGVARSESKATNDALDRIAQLRLGTYLGTSGDRLGADERLHGERVRLLQQIPKDYLDYLERINPVPPDMNAILQLAMAAGNAGGLATGGVPGMPIFMAPWQIGYQPPMRGPITWYDPIRGRGGTVGSRGTTGSGGGGASGHGVGGTQWRGTGGGVVTMPDGTHRYVGSRQTGSRRPRTGNETGYVNPPPQGMPRGGHVRVDDSGQLVWESDNGSQQIPLSQLLDGLTGTIGAAASGAGMPGAIGAAVAAAGLPGIPQASPSPPTPAEALRNAMPGASPAVSAIEQRSPSKITLPTGMRTQQFATEITRDPRFIAWHNANGGISTDSIAAYLEALRRNANSGGRIPRPIAATYNLPASLDSLFIA